MAFLSKQTVRRTLFAFLAFAGYLHAQTLKPTATIDLPGPKGERFDYLTMDDEDGYLLSAHLGPACKVRSREGHCGVAQQEMSSSCNR